MNPALVAIVFGLALLIGAFFAVKQFVNPPLRSGLMITIGVLGVLLIIALFAVHAATPER